MSEGGPDPLLVAAAALTCTIMTVSTPPPVSTAAAAALVLVLPGYAIGHALVPVVGRAERLTLSISLSLALAVLAGLGIAAVGNLDPAPWTMALSAITGIGALGIPERRDDAAHPERWVKLRRAVPVAIAASLALAMAGRAALIEARTDWATSGGTALALTRVGDPESDLAIEVMNAGPRDATYSLNVTVPGADPMTWPVIAVAAGRRWRMPIPVPTDVAGRVSATLEVQGSETPLRHVSAWLGQRPDDSWSAPPAPATVPAPNATASVAGPMEAIP